MTNNTNVHDDTFDAHADETIKDCLSATPPKSFFLFAGAGSGKTRSLIQALHEARKAKGKAFRTHGRKIAVITYTNNACDEIRRRIEFDDLFAVSTIHSFAWTLIKGLHHDIREWLRSNLQNEILELEEKERRGRPGTKTSVERIRKIETKRERLSQLETFKKFIYNPNGDNFEKNSLNHSEVIKISSGFITEKTTMQNIIINKFPILLIDESQDTNKKLINSLLTTQSIHKDKFAIGLIGDTMQRIYFDGETDLSKLIPHDWVTPEKKMNHRCYPRIVDLINNIRKLEDEHSQKPRSDKPHNGFLRLFLLSPDTQNREEAEKIVYEKMCEISGDQQWLSPNEVKTLVLEHRMAAKRLNFLEMWDPLNSVPSLQTGLRNGDLPTLRLFSKQILPALEAAKIEDRFAVGSIIRQFSPLLDKEELKQLDQDQLPQLKKASDALDSLVNLTENNPNTTFFEVLQEVATTNLFAIPDELKPFSRPIQAEEEDEEDDADKKTLAWRNFGNAPFRQIKAYQDYVSGNAPFETHHGVKGLEFPRVCVVMDDQNARGFMHSFEKLFGAKEGNENSIRNTLRLFYVTCSRAEESLALVMYSESPKIVSEEAMRRGWVSEDEIIQIM